MVDVPKGGVQLLDDTPIGPLSDEGEATVTVIVPVSWPVHVGRVGTPPLPTEIVYPSVIPESVPLRNPFNRTKPFGSRTVTGPLTTPFSCVKFQDIRASVVSTTIGPFQVPVRLSPPASGAVGVLSALHPIVNPSRTRAILAVFLMCPRCAKSVPPELPLSKSCAIVSLEEV